MTSIFSEDDVIVSRDIIGGKHYGESGHFSRTLGAGSRDAIHLLGNSCNQLFSGHLTMDRIVESGGSGWSAGQEVSFFRRNFRIFSEADVIVSTDLIGGKHYGESGNFSRALRAGSRDAILLLRTEPIGRSRTHHAHV